MTIRELLELAAKAAGYNMRWSMIHQCLWGHTREYWNPFEDDGDALRLAVKLRMEIDHNHDADNCLWVSVRVPRQVFCAVEEFADESERASSTRRAITRAAAEIGRNMP